VVGLAGPGDENLRHRVGGGSGLGVGLCVHVYILRDERV
jgi:hypothetical protein